ncbi:MAG: hypothetical protein OEV00_14685 [Acidobacteriota bacterium]|nr:hypothetical protein [Acidobacteriota bacterium]MDH3786556.1 hypothetical protein [Acidobacteriota bacterium]
MLQELLSIFRPGNPLAKMGDEFAEMLQITCDMNISAGRIYFREETSPEARTAIYRQDIRVNKLERHIRKRVVAHLSVGNSQHLPYCLLLMSQVKDVERLGDYAKNLAEVPDVYSGEMPENGLLSELQETRTEVEASFKATAEVFASSDRERAMTLIQHGKDVAKRADGMLSRIAQAGHSSGQTTALILGTRYYKRISGHLLNVLSSVVMPLHKVDYYDEKELPGVEPGN